MSPGAAVVITADQAIVAPAAGGRAVRGPTAVLAVDGAITHPVNNFRFNESPVQMLARCDGLGSTAVPSGGEGSGVRVPVLRTHEFNLASISEAV